MKTILLADDEANLQRLVHITLDDPGYHTGSSRLYMRTSGIKRPTH